MVLRATSWWSEPRFDDVVARRLWRGPNHANAPTAGLARVPATHGVEICRRRHGASWGHTVTSTTPRGRAFRPSGSVMASALWWARCDHPRRSDRYSPRSATPPIMLVP